MPTTPMWQFYFMHLFEYFISGATPGVSSLKAFLDGIQSSPNQEEISYVEFEEYYEGLSISIDNDMEFANILHNTWNI